MLILDRPVRDLAAVVDRYEGVKARAPIQAHRDAIAGRMAAALARQASIAQRMEECGEECGRERRGARFVRRISLSGAIRGRRSFARASNSG